MAGLVLLILAILSMVRFSQQEEMTTLDGKKCIFPFKYKGKWYNVCLKDEINPQYDDWCAVEHADYDKYFKMGRCDNRTIVPTKTLDGRDCFFPFTYQGSTYYRCAYDIISTWCSTKAGDYYTHYQWGYCVGGHRGPEGGDKKRVILDPDKVDYSNALKYNITVSGKMCMFPFIWQGLEMTECVYDYRGRPWCNVDCQGYWDFCLFYPNEEPKYTFDNLFSKIGETKEPKPADCLVTKNRLSQQEKDDILTHANKFRAEEKTAANIRKLTWSEHLAERAQQYADTCNRDHGGTTSCYGHALGQNLMIGFDHEPPNWRFVMYQAFGNSEKPFYDHTNNKCGGQGVCGHYTQSVWAETAEIGCAYQNCSDTQEDYQITICDYYPKGNMPDYGQSVDVIRRPYLHGNKCEKCKFTTYPYPYKCVDGSFCEPCREDESGCIKYDLCYDNFIHNATGVNDVCRNVGTLDHGCVHSRQDYLQDPKRYKSVRQSCRKSCRMCREPYDA